MRRWRFLTTADTEISLYALCFTRALASETVVAVRVISATNGRRLDDEKRMAAQRARIYPRRTA